MSTPIRTLLFSTLYPSSARPLHGIFVETRLRELLRLDGIETRVVAPVPWFPSTNSRWGDRARMASTPQREMRNGIDVWHPRYPLLPKIGMTTAPLMLALGSIHALRRLIEEGFDFDVIDAHYYYPDGVAAALLAAWFKKPFVVTARGSDVNLISRNAVARRMMVWAARMAGASIGVSAALVEVMREWGLNPDGLHVLRNGVDLDRFKPLRQEQVRTQLGLSGGPILLSVGSLIPVKGHDLTVAALAALSRDYPDAQLFLIGAGPERSKLEALAREVGVAQRVRFVGVVDNAELATWYSAADLSILASSREGWANVLLESLACGTPVVATRVGGTPEVLANAAVGRLVAIRETPHLAAQIDAMLREPVDRPAIRKYAEGFGWATTSQSQLKLLTRIIAGNSRA